MNKYPRSAYVHIPFCHRRCFYCDFAVIPLGNKVETLQGYGSKTVKEYLYFLYKEILSIKHKSPLSTINSSEPLYSAPNNRKDYKGRSQAHP